MAGSFNPTHQLSDWLGWLLQSPGPVAYRKEGTGVRYNFHPVQPKRSGGDRSEYNFYLSVGINARVAGFN
jgi:hypothetical protein